MQLRELSECTDGYSTQPCPERTWGSSCVSLGARAMSVNRILCLVFVVAIIVVAGKIAYPSGNALSYRVFDGFYWLSVSYLPSYFVYLLVVYLPRRREQKNLSVFVANQTAMLIGDGQAIHAELSKAAKHTSIFRQAHERSRMVKAAPMMWKGCVQQGASADRLAFASLRQHGG
jgi:hypothetical protein